MMAARARRAVGARPRVLLGLSVVAVALAPTPCGAWAAEPANAPFDLVIEGGRVVDGTGSPWYRADVGVRGGHIVAVGQLAGRPAARRLPAQGLVVSPGFIDVSSDNLERLTQAPLARNVVLQGVTTLIGGNDGMSPFPVADFTAERSRAPASVNVGTWVGHGTIRLAVMDRRPGPPTSAELARMRELIGEAMRSGAFGLSTGLEPAGFHEPGHFAETPELVVAAREAARFGGIYISHIRSEQADVVEAVREAIRIAEEAGVAVQVTHHKITGKPNWGRSQETLRLVEEARRRGLDVTLDQFPYTHVGVGVSQFFPKGLLDGGARNIAAAMEDPRQRRIVREHVRTYLEACGGAAGLRTFRIRNCASDPTLAGLRLVDFAARAHPSPAPSDIADALIDLQGKGGCVGDLVDAASEDDVRRILVSPYSMVASDSPPETDPPVMDAPKSYGTFARVAGHYVRTGVLSLEEAVRKMTSFPASRLRIVDRGILRPGMKADIAVFDPERFADRATVDRPLEHAVGMVDVLVNGELVLDNGAITGRRPGAVLYGPGKR